MNWGYLFLLAIVRTVIVSCSLVFLSGCTNEYIEHNYSTELVEIEDIGSLKIVLRGTFRTPSEGLSVRGAPYQLVFLYYPLTSSNVCLEKIYIKQATEKWKVDSIEASCGTKVKSPPGALYSHYFIYDDIILKEGDDVSIEFDLAVPGRFATKSLMTKLHYSMKEDWRFKISDAISGV